MNGFVAKLCTVVVGIYLDANDKYWCGMLKMSTTGLTLSAERTTPAPQRAINKDFVSQLFVTEG